MTDRIRCFVARSNRLAQVGGNEETVDGDEMRRVAVLIAASFCAAGAGARLIPRWEKDVDPLPR